jgi:hypothetical protein
MIVADQLPTAIAVEAIKNTNVKVMHRLVSADDREELGKAMLLDAGQVEIAAALPPGRSLVHMEGWAKSRLVAEPDFKAQFGLEQPPDDGFVQARMSGIRAQAPFSDCYLPYAACRKLCEQCDAKVREAVERYALRVRSTLADQLQGEPREDWASIARDVYLEGVTSGKLSGLPDSAVEGGVAVFCAVVHLDEKVLKGLEVDGS